MESMQVWWCVLVTRLAAVCKSQAVSDYSRIGRIRASYAASLVFLFPMFRFLLRKPSVLFALLVMSM